MIIIYSWLALCAVILFCNGCAILYDQYLYTGTFNKAINDNTVTIEDVSPLDVKHVIFRVSFPYYSGNRYFYVDKHSKFKFSVWDSGPQGEFSQLKYPIFLKKKESIPDLILMNMMCE